MMAVWPGEMVAQVVNVVRLEVCFPRTTRGPWDVRERRQAGLQALCVWQGGEALGLDRQGAGGTGLEGSRSVFLIPGHL